MATRTRAACPAFIIAIFTASTRLIWPAPTAQRRSGPVKMTVFDFTCAQTRQAKRSACHSAAVGWRFVTTRRSGIGVGAGSRTMGDSRAP